MLIICVPNFKAKDSPKKIYSKSTNMCSCEKPFHCCQLWHPPKSQGLNFFSFYMNFFPQGHLYVDYMYKKFQVPKIHIKKDIWNPPTCVVVRKISLLPTLIPYQSMKNCYFAINFLAWYHLYVDKTCDKFQGQKMHTKKDIDILPTCIIGRMIFSALRIGSFYG